VSWFHRHDASSTIIRAGFIRTPRADRWALGIREHRVASLVPMPGSKALKYRHHIVDRDRGPCEAFTRFRERRQSCSRVSVSWLRWVMPSLAKAA
jgi:hypothetical protein